jgi:FkbM family methyltransferase
VRQHLQLLRAGWRPRSDRIVKGTAWLPLDSRWAISNWMEPLVRTGFAFENGGANEFAITAPDGSRFITGPTELLDLLGALHERFVLREYDLLDARGAVVIDIGAYVGDSALYFAHKGAAKVYAYEPFQATYAAARRNVRLSGLDDVIELRQLGLGAERGTIDGVLSIETPMLSATAASVMRVTGAAEPVQLVTLASVVGEVRSMHPEARLVCKMDCEGAEFDVLTPASLPALRELDQLMVEYHHRSPRPICDVLEAAGFATALPEDSVREDAGGPVGMIVASRRVTA